MPDDLYYHKEHFWARVEGNTVTLGTTDFAQKLAGQIVYVELPALGKSVEQGKPCGSMESGKWVGRIPTHRFPGKWNPPIRSLKTPRS